MYSKILIPLENTVTDLTILEHIRTLAKLTGASLVIMHVADGWAARNFEQLNLAESQEIKEDRAYLERIASELRQEGFTVEAVLEMGEPSERIIHVSKDLQVNLIAMATHGHRLLGDLIQGSTADKVRHLVEVPVLMLKAKAN
jgi:nucleotide-binding universal stress UspA family protein